MDRRLLFPVIAITAWAQQQPAQPAAEALRDRVRQYYQLMVEKKYRQAEAMVAEESKDDYYAGQKPEIKAFEITMLDLQTETTAKVTIRIKVLVLMPGAGAQIFDVPSATYWKLENGAWNWYIPAETKGLTPFGKMQPNSAAGTGTGMDMKGAAPGSLTSPDFAALLNQVHIDKSSITLTAQVPVQLVTIENGLPGPITLALDPHVKTLTGLTVEVEPAAVAAGAKAVIRIRRTGNKKFSDVVVVNAEPFHRSFEIMVRSE